MKQPKTLKSYLKLLLILADTSPYHLKGITVPEANLLSYISANIQTELGEDEIESLLKKC